MSGLRPSHCIVPALNMSRGTQLEEIRPSEPRLGLAWTSPGPC